MALVNTLNLAADGRVSIKLKNHGTGKADRVAYIAAGTFGSGTITVQASPDGTTWAGLATAVTFTANTMGTFDFQSDEEAPMYLGFSLSGATTPDIDIQVYDVT